jgi:alkylation response protein AidB-like acyl-CoA dehydrogenase
MPAIKFRGVDFIQYDSLLTEEERLVRDTTRQFIEDNLIPIIEECNRAGRFPRELVKPMADLGFFGASLKGYGCAGMGNVEYGLMTQELERGDSGVRSFVSVQSGLCMYPIYAFGSDEQKDQWLPAMQKGEKLGCFGLTEPDFGSNPGGMRTRAKKVGSEYVINGEKMWITSGSIADVAIIWAKVEDEDDRIRGFLVETDRPGFKADDIHGKWSLRASVTSGLSLQDVHISADVSEPGALWHRVGSAGGGDVVLRLRAAVFAAAQAVARSAYRVASTRAGQADVDDQRNHEGAVARAAGGTTERRRQSAAAAYFDGQAQQCLDGSGVRPPVARYPRSEWSSRRLSHHAAHDEPRVGEDLRGHARRTLADYWAECDGD